MLRHWKQRFTPGAKFVWNKPVIWQSAVMSVGDPIPDDLAKNPAKLKRFWDSKTIALAEFEPPKAYADKAILTPESRVYKEGRRWMVIGVKKVFQTKHAAMIAASELETK